MMENNAYSGVDNELLPNGWERCTISDIVEVNPKKTVADADLVSGFVPMSHAPTDFNGPLKFDEKLWGEIKKSYTNFKDGDVIFAKVTPCFENGKAAIVRDLPNGIGAGSSEFYVLRPYSEEISEKFVFSLIKSHEFLQQGAENMTGAVGLRRVPRAFVESFPVNLPPLAEQKVIAETLDTLLAQVESIQTRLERVPHILKRFRQSVLAAAVSGKLSNKTGLPENTWPEVSLSELCLSAFDGPFGSKLKSSDYTDSGIGVVRLENIKHLSFDREKETFISESKYETLKKNKLEKDDVLFSSFVDEEVRVCLFPYDEKVYINKADCFCLRVDRNKANPVFMMYLLASQSSYTQIKEHVQGVTRPRVNLRLLKFLKFKVPKLDEQTEIVRRVEQLFAYADTIEQQVNQALARVNNLTQSILARAFSGELTRAWREANPELVSGDNSAEALLARIQAERVTQKKTRTKKGRTAATQ